MQSFKTDNNSQSKQTYPLSLIVNMASNTTIEIEFVPKYFENTVKTPWKPYIQKKKTHTQENICLKYLGD